MSKIEYRWVEVFRDARRLRDVCGEGVEEIVLSPPHVFLGCTQQDWVDVHIMQFFNKIGADGWRLITAANDQGDTYGNGFYTFMRVHASS